MTAEIGETRTCLLWESLNLEDINDNISISSLYSDENKLIHLNL